MHDRHVEIGVYDVRRAQVGGRRSAVCVTDREDGVCLLKEELSWEMDD